MGSAVRFNRKQIIFCVCLALCFLLIFSAYISRNQRPSQSNDRSYINFKAGEEPKKTVREKLKLSPNDVPVVIVDEHQEGLQFFLIM